MHEWTYLLAMKVCLLSPIDSKVEDPQIQRISSLKDIYKFKMWRNKRLTERAKSQCLQMIGHNTH